MKKYLLLLAVSGLFLTSCEKCKDCEIAIDLDNSYPLTDADCQASFGMNCEDYLTNAYSAAEYCGDELEAIESTADVTGVGYRVYWDCK